MNTSDLLKWVVGELQAFLAPIVDVAEEPREAVRLGARVGWDLEALKGTALDNLALAVRATVAEIPDPSTLGDVSDAQAAVDLVQRWLQGATSHIPAIGSALAASTPMLADNATLCASFAKDLTVYLWIRYLARRQPAVLSIALTLEIVQETRLSEIAVVDDQGARIILRASVPRLGFDQEVFNEITSSPPAWLARIVQGGNLAQIGDLVTHLVAALATVCGRRKLEETWALDVQAGRLQITGLLPPKSERLEADLPLPSPFHAHLVWVDQTLALTWNAGIASDLVLFSEAGITVTIPTAGEALRGWSISSVNGVPTFLASGSVRLQFGAPFSSLPGCPLELEANARLICPLGGKPTFVCSVDALLPSLQIAGITLQTPRVCASEFALPPSGSSLFEVTGTLALPGGHVLVSATLRASGVVLTSTADLELLGGVRLTPVDGAPVLSANLSTTDQRIAFTARGRLAIPSVSAASLVLAGSLVVSPSGIESVSIASAASHTLELPGGLSLSNTSAELTLAGGALDVGLQGDVSPPGFERPVRIKGGFALTDAGQLHLSASAEIMSLSLHKNLWLRRANLSLFVDLTGRSGRLDLLDASGGLFLRTNASGKAITDYELGMEGMSAACRVVDRGLVCEWTSGRILLPSLFSNETGERAAIGVDSLKPLTLSTPLTGDATLEGTLVVTNICVRLGEQADAFVAKLDRATVEIRSKATVPVRLTEASGSITLPLPSDRVLTLGYRDVAFQMDGLPEGEIALLEDVGFALGDESKALFSLTLLGGTAGAAQRTKLKATRKDGGDTTFVLTGAVRTTFSPKLLADENGMGLAATANASITLSSNLAIAPQINELSLEVKGTFRLGDASEGLLLKDGKVAWNRIERVFGAKGPEPMELGIEGSVGLILEGQQGSGPSLQLKSTRFRFDDGPFAMPTFQTEGMSLSTGTLFFDLFKLDKVGFNFVDSTLALPELLSPDNLRLTAEGIQLNLAVNTRGLLGRVEGVLLSLANGIPRLSLQGIAFGVDNLDLVGMKVSGALRLSGFRSFPKLSLAGVLGGSSSGTAVRVLYAHGLGIDADPKTFRSFAALVSRPLGAALEVSAGGAGIPVYQTGILITGASGGVSYANTNQDPTEFVTYLDAAHQVPVRLDDAATDDLELGSDRPISAPDCPCQCPPPAMNVFCQPHPDPARRSAILKFSSLDERFLERTGLAQKLKEADKKLAACETEIEKEAKRQLDAFLDEAAAQFVALLNVAKDASGATTISTGNPTLDRVLRDPGGYWKGEVKSLAEAAFTAALAEAKANAQRPSLYEVVRDVLYAGLPCPDVTLQVTGTISYTGVSPYLSVTGGINMSTSGSIGVLGYLNVLGLQFGRLRGFFTFTSATGDPDPSLCGDLRFVLGPLELGNVNFRYACPGFIIETGKHLVQCAEDLGAPLIGRLLKDVAPRLAEATDAIKRDPGGVLAQMQKAEALGFAAKMLSASEKAFEREDLDRIQKALFTLARNAWTSFQPEVVFCGEVAPRLFGLTLAKLVTAKGWSKKDAMGVSVGFSPLAVLACIAGDPLLFFIGRDSGTIALQYEMPRVDELVYLGLSGRAQTAADAAEAADRAFARFLSRAALTFTYELSPLGMKLIDAQGRVLMPNFAHHPATPHSGWKRPEDRGLLPRADVLLKAHAKGKLADGSWAGDLAALYPKDPTLKDLHLLEDYFPHGGFLGAATMVAPRALTQPPPLDTLGKLFSALSAKNAKGACESAIELVSWLGSGMDQVGYLYFYVPAPNPPTFSAGGKPLTPRQLARQLVDLQLPPGGPLEAGALYSSDLMLLAGRLSGSLFGIPLGDAVLTFVPPSGSSPGVARATFCAGKETWLAAVLGTLDVTLELRLPAPSALGPVTIEEGLSRLEAALRGSDEEDFTLQSFVAELSKVLPRATLEARARPENIKLFEGRLAQMFQWGTNAEAVLRGYGVASDPTASMEDPIGRAKLLGGLVFEAHCKLKLGFDIELDLPQFMAVLEPHALGVRVCAEIKLDSARLRADMPVLRDATLRIDSAPPRGAPWITLEGRFDGGLRLGAAELRRTTERPLSVRFSASERGLSIELSPAELRLPWLSGPLSILLHGKTVSDPFAVSASGPWDAGITMTARGGTIVVRDDAANDILALSPPEAIKGTLSGRGLDFESLRLTLAGGMGVVAFPGIGELAPRFSIPGASTATLTITPSEIALAGHCRPLRFGIFVVHGAASADAELDIALSREGLAITSGAALRLDVKGFAAESLPIRSFHIGTNGDVEATTGAAVIDLPGNFRMQARSARFARKGAAVSLSLSGASITLFRGTPLEYTFDVDEGLSPPRPREMGKPADSVASLLSNALKIDSAGRFHLKKSLSDLSVPGLFTAKGSLELGYVPLPLKSVSILGTGGGTGKPRGSHTMADKGSVGISSVAAEDKNSPYGAYLWLRDATFDVCPLFGQSLVSLRGDARLTTTSIDARLEGGTLQIPREAPPAGVPRLFEAHGGSFQFTYQIGSSLTLHAKGAGVSILGVGLLPRLSFDVEIDAQGNAQASCTASGTMKLLPGLLHLKHAAISVGNSNKGHGWLDIKGKIEILPEFGIDKEVDFNGRIEGGPFRCVLMDANALKNDAALPSKWFPDNSLLKFSMGELVLRGDSRGLALELDHVGAELNLPMPSSGEAFELGDFSLAQGGVQGSGRFSLAGLRLELALTGDRFSLGPFSLVPDAQSKMVASLPLKGANEPFLSLPTCHVKSSLPGWPAFELPATTVTPSHGILRTRIALTSDEKTIDLPPLRIKIPALYATVTLGWGFNASTTPFITLDSAHPTIEWKSALPEPPDFDPPPCDPPKLSKDCRQIEITVPKGDLDFGENLNFLKDALPDKLILPL